MSALLHHSFNNTCCLVASRTASNQSLSHTHTTHTHTHTAMLTQLTTWRNLEAYTVAGSNACSPPSASAEGGGACVACVGCRVSLSCPPSHGLTGDHPHWVFAELLGELPFHSHVALILGTAFCGGQRVGERASRSHIPCGLACMGSTAHMNLDLSSRLLLISPAIRALRPPKMAPRLQQTLRASGHAHISAVPLLCSSCRCGGHTTRRREQWLGSYQRTEQRVVRNK
jgi:hypothetical protein